MECPKCKRMIADDAAFCPNCGTDVLEWKAAPNPETLYSKARNVLIRLHEFVSIPAIRRELWVFGGALLFFLLWAALVTLTDKYLVVARILKIFGFCILGVVALLVAGAIIKFLLKNRGTKKFWRAITALLAIGGIIFIAMRTPDFDEWFFSSKKTGGLWLMTYVIWRTLKDREKDQK